MKEQFVPYEIAVKLKEKGFDEPCFGIYNLYETYGQYGIINIGDLYLININKRYKGENAIIAPLWQQAIDWFETKGIFISIKYAAPDTNMFCYRIDNYNHVTTKQSLIPTDKGLRNCS